jgi:Flp pilus assembly protein TadG
MRLRFCANAKQRIGADHGAVAVEFAILLPVFLLLVFGILDFGHGLYMKHMVTNASREGARYATRYRENAGTRIIPQNLVPSITNYVIKTSAENSNKGGCGLDQLMPTDANPQVSNADLTDGAKSPGYTTGTTGSDITVTVTATKHWWVIGSLIPTLGDKLDLSGTTVMKCE